MNEKNIVTPNLSQSQWTKDFFTAEVLALLIVGFLMVVYIVGNFSAFFLKCLVTSCTRKVKYERNSKKNKRFLIVIAHPDDECMFFGPTIINLIQNNKNIFVLCLSNGNYEGKGKVRKQELWLSCFTMGILTSNITLLQFDKLKDSPDLDWPPILVSRAIKDHVHSLDIDTLITFDGSGVSGHRNHVAINRAVNLLITQNQWPEFCQVQVLESVNIFRMYVFNFLDLTFSYCTSPSVYFVDVFQRAYIVGAMKCHQSQMLWYRKLYLIFSRYILINTLKEIYAAQPRNFAPVKDKDE